MLLRGATKTHKGWFVGTLPSLDYILNALGVLAAGIHSELDCFNWSSLVTAVKPLEYQLSSLIDSTWTEPKSYYVKFGRTAIPTSNGHISEMKQDFLDPLVPKFSYDRGLSPVLSWKWPSATLSPSFGLFRAEKPRFRGVPGVCRCGSLVRICPRDRFPSRKKKFTR